jgi:hypothetical protein
LKENVIIGRLIPARLNAASMDALAEAETLPELQLPGGNWLTMDGGDGAANNDDVASLADDAVIEEDEGDDDFFDDEDDDSDEEEQPLAAEGALDDRAGADASGSEEGGEESGVEASEEGAAPQEAPGSPGVVAELSSDVSEETVLEGSPMDDGAGG